MLICCADPTNGQHRPNRDEGKEINIEDVHSVRAIVIPAKGQAGLQAQYFDEVLFKDLETEELLTTDKHAGKYFKIEVTGDSMDDGTPKGLQAGDWAYCRSLSKLHWRDKLHTHKWRIWCFFHNERGIIFKRNDTIPKGVENRFRKHQGSRIHHKANKVAY